MSNTGYLDVSDVFESPSSDGLVGQAMIPFSSARSGTEGRTAMSGLYSSRSTNCQENQERTPTLYRPILGPKTHNKYAQATLYPGVGQTVVFESLALTARLNHEIPSELPSKPSSKTKRDEDEESMPEPSNLKIHKSEEGRPSMNTHAGNNSNSIPPPELLGTTVPRPQKRPKDTNSALSKKLAAKGGPVGDDRQVKGEFRRVQAGYGMFKDQNNPIERR